MRQGVRREGVGLKREAKVEVKLEKATQEIGSMECSNATCD
jgi:hypothetical protein